MSESSPSAAEEGEVIAMISSPNGPQLHDKATRGEALSAEEAACLEQWYALQDQEESAYLAKAPPKSLT